MTTEKDLSLRLELIESMSTLVSAGFGLVAALAWNDAIQELFRQVFGTANGLVAKFVYAAFITTVVVLLTRRFSRLANRLKRAIKESKQSPTFPTANR